MILVVILLPSVSSRARGAEMQSDALAPARAAWQEHYQPLLVQGMVRPFNEPRIFDHGQRTAQVVVLIHGLTDSPYFLDEIGRIFYAQGFNVLVPLLPGHGLVQPDLINQVTYGQWIDEVDFAMHIAAMMGETISIGGLSTGGALAMHTALFQPERVKGAIFLFSTALSIGSWQEFFARSPFFDKFVSAWLKFSRRVIDGEKVDGIGINPYRYSHMFFLPVQQLILLNDVIRSRYKDATQRYADLLQPVFIAHSAADATAQIEEIDKVAANHRDAAKEVTFFRIPASFGVQHASLVFDHDITVMKAGELLVLEKRNPLFEAMVAALKKFISNSSGNGQDSGSRHNP